MGYKRKTHAGHPFVKVHIPAWIQPVDVIVAPYKLSASKMRVVLHNFYLCMVTAMLKRDYDRSPWLRLGYFPVHWTILKQVASNDYPAYIKVLEDKGIIERRRNSMGGRNYLPGIHAQLFRFIHREGDIKFRVEKLYDYRCIKAILRTRDRYAIGEYDDTKSREMNQTHRKLREYVLNCFIDTDIAADIMNRLDPDGNDDPYLGLDLDYFDSINENKIGWFSVDSFGERCHSHFTSLKSEYRAALRFRGYEDQALEHIDIKNSQPYFSAALAANDRLIDDMLPEFKALKPLISEVSARPDNKSYFDLCISGLLYEHMGDLMGKNRSQVKQQFFRAVLFSKSRVYGEDRDMMEVFKRCFPSVSQFFKEIKKLTESDLPALKDIITEKRAKYTNTKNSHKILCCAMQRLESRLVTQHIAGCLIEAGVGPFLTIHDSFLVLPQHRQMTVRCIEDTCRSFGIEPPRLSIQLLDNPHTIK